MNVCGVGLRSSTVQREACVSVRGWWVTKDLKIFGWCRSFGGWVPGRKGDGLNTARFDRAETWLDFLK